MTDFSNNLTHFFLLIMGLQRKSCQIFVRRIMQYKDYCSKTFLNLKKKNVCINPISL